VTKPETTVRRGEIYWLDWNPPRGSEQAGRRPGLIVQNDPFNTNARYPNTIVVALTTKGRNVPTHIAIDPSAANGLQQRSYVKCEQVMTVSKERLGGLIGELDAGEMARVSRALKRVLSLL
jgi:mRNA interferase MazF